MIVTENDLENVSRRVWGQTKLSIDTETTGVRETDRAFSYIIGTKDSEFYFDSRILPKRAMDKFANVSLHNKNLIYQNAKFDLRMMDNTYGTKLCENNKTEDIAVMARLCRNDHLQYNLASQAKRAGWEKIDEVIKYIEQHKVYENGDKSLPRYDQVPLELMARYAKMDARLTYDLHARYDIELDPRSRNVWETEKLVTPVCYRMERTGIKVNKEYTTEAMNYELGLIHEAKSQFRLAAGCDYNTGKKFLVDVFRKAGETIPKTEKGNDSLTDEVLESFSSPIAQIIQKIRHHEKRVSTYYQNFLALSDNNGILHPDMWQGGTTTGRFSYRDPNLQNVPNEEDSVDPYVVRGCFEPRYGKVFVALDFRQQEYRLMLAYAKIPQLIAQVMAGFDVHQAIADLVGIPRKYAKTLNFAILYGAGIEKISKMLGIDLREAGALKKKYFDAIPAVESFIFQVVKTGAGRGHIYNWYGRKLFINSSEFAYKLPNHLIQSGGADICKIAMVECDKYIKEHDIQMVLQVHDALYFEMKQCELDVHIPKLKQIMIDSFPGKNDMFMDVDAKWSAKSLADRDLVKWK